MTTTRAVAAYQPSLFAGEKERVGYQWEPLFGLWVINGTLYFPPSDDAIRQAEMMTRETRGLER